RSSSGTEALVGVSDAPVVLLFEFVFPCTGCRVAAQPELLDEMLALFVGLEAEECFLLCISDDVNDVLREPALIRTQLLLRGRELNRRHKIQADARRCGEHANMAAAWGRRNRARFIEDGCQALFHLAALCHRSRVEPAFSWFESSGDI